MGAHARQAQRRRVPGRYLISLPHSSPATHGAGTSPSLGSGPAQPNLFPPDGPSVPPAGGAGGFNEGGQSPPIQSNDEQPVPGQPTGGTSINGDIFGTVGGVAKDLPVRKAHIGAQSLVAD